MAIGVNRLLRPHWKALAVAFVAVIVEKTNHGGHWDHGGKEDAQ
jgi:hypothetical protein